MDLEAAQRDASEAQFIDKDTDTQRGDVTYQTMHKYTVAEMEPEPVSYYLSRFLCKSVFE